MNTTPPNDSVPNNGDLSEVTISPTAMRHPTHSVLDTEEIAGLDEAMHEAALRDSQLRTPR